MKCEYCGKEIKSKDIVIGKYDFYCNEECKNMYDHSMYEAHVLNALEVINDHIRSGMGTVPSSFRDAISKGSKSSRNRDKVPNTC